MQNADLGIANIFDFFQKRLQYLKQKSFDYWSILTMFWCNEVLFDGFIQLMAPN